MKRIKFLFICFQSFLLLSAATWTHTTVGYGVSPDRPVITSDPMGYLHVAFIRLHEDFLWQVLQTGEGSRYPSFHGPVAGEIQDNR